MENKQKKFVRKGPRPHVKEASCSLMSIPDVPTDLRMRAKAHAALLGMGMREYLLTAISEKNAQMR